MQQNSLRTISAPKKCPARFYEVIGYLRKQISRLKRNGLNEDEAQRLDDLLARFWERFEDIDAVQRAHALETKEARRASRGK